MHELFPVQLGFGVLYDTSKKTDAYKMNLRKCPNPKIGSFNDCIYVTLFLRLDQEIRIRRKPVSCNVNGRNPSKRRKATQVRFLKYLTKDCSIRFCGKHSSNTVQCLL